MNKLLINDKNLGITLLGGQAFNWDLIDNSYYGFFKDHIIKVKQKNDKYFWQTYPENDNSELISEYFDLNNLYDEHKLKMQKDINISEAINFVGDVRILNQDFEQTFLSFILTSHKNIKAVRKLVRDLSKYYGTTIEVDGLEFKTFPTIESLANTSETKLRELGAGFRARYLLEAAQRLSQIHSKSLSAIDLGTTSKHKKDLNDASKLQKYLTEISEDELRRFLTSFNGIGEKIADCIMVFSLKQRFTTPLDIWGQRVITHIYKVEGKMNYSQMRAWLRDYFGEYTAYAGQYLFEYIRSNWEKYSKG